MNTESKSIFLSVTFWGLVLSLVGPVLAHYGITLPGDTAGLANELAMLVGDAVAVYGRLRATQPAHIIAPPTPPAPLTGA